VIVVSSLDRNRWALDNADEKIKFLKSDPAVTVGHSVSAVMALWPPSTLAIKPEALFFPPT
jgi:hypothetical protein